LEKVDVTILDTSDEPPMEEAPQIMSKLRMALLHGG
jgi:hypothetical protein